MGTAQPCILQHRMGMLKLCSTYSHRQSCIIRPTWMRLKDSVTGLGHHLWMTLRVRDIKAVKTFLRSELASECSLNVHACSPSATFSVGWMFSQHYGSLSPRE